MKKKLLGIFFVLLFTTFSFAGEKIKAIYEGNHDAKIKLIIMNLLLAVIVQTFIKMFTLI